VLVVVVVVYVAKQKRNEIIISKTSSFKNKNK